MVLRMRALLRDPLVHFLALGVVLFVMHAWRSEGVAPEHSRIDVRADRVAALAEAVTILNGGRRPTREELAPLVEPLIREEILYREALRLGLAEGDALVRERLVDKMRFLTEDRSGAPAVPNDVELAAFVAARPAQFPAGVALAEVRDAALEAYRAEQRQLANAAAHAALRENYDVRIEWPEAGIASAAP
jgi:hypothetical protein